MRLQTEKLNSALVLAIGTFAQKLMNHQNIVIGRGVSLTDHLLLLTTLIGDDDDGLIASVATCGSGNDDVQFW